MGYENWDCVWHNQNSSSCGKVLIPALVDVVCPLLAVICLFDTCLSLLIRDETDNLIPES